MIELAKEIKTRWDSTSGAAIRKLLADEQGTAAIYNMEAPHGAKLPIVIFLMPASGPVEGAMSTSGIAHIENQIVQFSIFVPEYKLDLAYQVRDALCKLYDNYRFYFGTAGSLGHVLMVKRNNHGVLVKNPEGGYGIHVDYAYKMDEVL